MANIFGTILSIGDFLENKRTQVTIQRGDESHTIFSLEQDRRYIIPDYQREIRWLKEHAIELIIDINHKSKFLGNIILNKRSPTEYEIIDGQQRITVLLMIIYYIKSKFEQEIDVWRTCRLEMANFDKFHLLIDNNFEISNLSPETKEEVETSDIFNQREKYKLLWSEFNNISILQSSNNCRAFLRNLESSQVNLIININDTRNSSIEYFLDVNLKGVRLDKEEIFKGYLFSLDSSQTIRNEWKSFKMQSFTLNDKTEYPTTKLLEHYLYCSLYKHDIYRNIQFGENFLVNEIELNSVRHYTGEHIIKVVNNNAYMVESLRNINKFLRIVLDIINSGLPSQSFKALFNASANIDDIEVTIIHSFIKKVMLDKNVVPRILIMKYILEVLFETTGRTKNDYRKIYNVYLLAVLFTVFENDKDIKKVLGVVKDPDWHIKAVEQSKNYFSRDKISQSRITVQYKLINSDGEENHLFRCKSLATIYNFFQIHGNTVKIINGKMNDLKVYISNSDKFSNEHFIINDSKNCKIISGTDSRIYEYPTNIKKYVNSIFNYVFINKELNHELSNNTLWEKIYILDEKISICPTTIECEFSKMVLERCKIEFTSPVSLPIRNIDETLNEIDVFYKNEFIQQFSTYALGIIKKIEEKLVSNT